METARVLALAGALSLALAACGGAAAQPASSPAAAAPSGAAAKPAAPSAAAPASAAAKPPAAAPAASVGLAKVRYGVGTNPLTITTAGAYLAYDNGFFKDQGLDVEITGYVGGTTAVRALLSHDIDIASTTADTVFLAHQNGAPTKVIEANVTKILDEIVGVKSVGALKDLTGKNWAISAPNSQSQGFAKIVLQKNGVDPNKVNFVAIGSPADRVKSLLAGRADVTTMVTFDQAEVLAAIQRGDIKVLGSVGEQAPDLANQYEITRDDLIKSQPAVLAKFVTAEMQGFRWMAANPEKAATIAQKHVPSSTYEDMLRGLKEMIAVKAWGVDGGFTLDGVDKAQVLYQQLGIISKTEKAADVADQQFIDQANKTLGPVKA